MQDRWRRRTGEQERRRSEGGDIYRGEEVEGEEMDTRRL
jgi:hypothetical protein